MLAFSPSADCLAVASEKSVFLIEPATGKQKECLPHPQQVLTVQYSPDGQTLASRCEDGSVRLWDAVAGKERRLLDGFGVWVAALAFSPDGKTLVANGAGFTFETWETATGKRIRTVEWEGATEKGVEPRESVVCAAIAPDGKAIALGTDRRWEGDRPPEDGRVYLIDMASGKKLRRFDGRYAGASALAFSRDGSLLAAAVWNTSCILVWEVASGRRVFQSPEHISESVCFSPDGRTVVSGTDEGIIRIWDLATGKERERPPEHCDRVLAIAFAPDGRNVVTRSGDRTSRLWEAATGRSLFLLPPVQGYFQEYADVMPEIPFVPNDRTILCQREEHALSLCEMTTGREVGKFPGLGHNISTYAVSPDCMALAVRTLDEKLKERWVHLLDATTGKELRRLHDPANSYSSGGAWFGDDGPLGFSPDGRVLASVSYNKVRLWDAATGKERYRLEGHQGHIHSLTFFPGGRLLGTEGGGVGFNRRPWQRRFDRTNRIWEVATGRQLSVVEDKEAPFWRTFAPDGRTYAATAMEDVLLCEAATGQPLVRFPNPRTECEAVAFSPDAERLAAGYHDGIGLVWDLTPQGWQAPTAKATPEQLRQFWTDLGGEDAPLAHSNIYTLGHHGTSALAFLRDRLKPVPKDFAERLRQTIADLDADAFRTRESAMRELTRLGPDAVLPLHAALDAKPSVEARNRIEALLKELHPWYIKDPEILRTVRAIWVLQRMATPEARAVLDTLAAGAPEARITQEAQAALRFLDRNRKP